MLKYRHTYRGESQFTTWMYRIARNAWIDQHRKRRHEVQQLNEDNEPVSADPLPLDNLESKQRAAILQKALTHLSVEKREVLVLSRYQNMKYEEIAELMDCTVSTVKVRVHRAIKDLRQIVIKITADPDFA